MTAKILLVAKNAVYLTIGCGIVYFFFITIMP